MTAQEILATMDDKHIGMLANYVQHGWPATKAETQRKYKELFFQRRGIIIPTSLEKKELDQLHIEASRRKNY